MDKREFELLKLDVSCIFPDADHKFITNICLKYKNAANILDNVVKDMTENSYTKRTKPVSVASSYFLSNNKIVTDKITPPIDFSSSTWETSYTYRIAALRTLSNQYPFIEVDSLKQLFSKSNYRYSITIETLQKELGLGVGTGLGQSGLYKDSVWYMTKAQKAEISISLKILGLKMCSVFRYVINTNLPTTPSLTFSLYILYTHIIYYIEDKTQNYALMIVYSAKNYTGYILNIINNSYTTTTYTHNILTTQ